MCQKTEAKNVPEILQEVPPHSKESHDEKAVRMYNQDAVFKGIVDSMVGILNSNQLTKDDLMNAYCLACVKVIQIRRARDKIQQAHG